MMRWDRGDDKMRISRKYEPKSLVLSIMTLLISFFEVMPNEAEIRSR